MQSPKHSEIGSIAHLCKGKPLPKNFPAMQPKTNTHSGGNSDIGRHNLLFLAILRLLIGKYEHMSFFFAPGGWWAMWIQKYSLPRLKSLWSSKRLNWIWGSSNKGHVNALSLEQILLLLLHIKNSLKWAGLISADGWVWMMPSGFHTWLLAEGTFHSRRRDVMGHSPGRLSKIWHREDPK